MRQVRRRITAPYCTCKKIGFGFTCKDGVWVSPCCMRPTRTFWMSQR